MKNELGHFWKRFEALEPTMLCKNLYSIEVVRFLKRALKKKAGLIFSEDDILDSIHRIITKKLDSIKPKAPTNVFPKKTK